jgi:hypothetical protein
VCIVLFDHATQGCGSSVSAVYAVEGSEAASAASTSRGADTKGPRTLCQWLWGAGGIQASAADRLDLCYDMVKAVKKWQSANKGQVHGALKLERFEVDAKRNLSVASGSGTLKASAKPAVLDFRYTAPEFFLSEGLITAKDPFATVPTVQPSADVFSLAYALVEVMTGQTVFANDPCDLALVQRVIDDNVRPQLSADDKRIPSAFVAMIHDMWHLDGDARPTVSQLVPRLRDMYGMVVLSVCIESKSGEKAGTKGERERERGTWVDASADECR